MVVPRNRMNGLKRPRKLFSKTPDGLVEAVAFRNNLLAKVTKYSAPSPKRKRKVMAGVYRALDKNKYAFWFVYREVDGKKTKISFFELKYGPNARLMAEQTRLALNEGKEPPVFEL